jgi:hypothetical protein
MSLDFKEADLGFARSVAPRGRFPIHELRQILDRLAAAVVDDSPLA